MAQNSMTRKKSKSAATGKGRRAKSSTRRKASDANGVAVIPRATAGYDEDDVLLSGGGSSGVGFGRCGGRILSTKVEQQICDMLSSSGVTHSHSPRHFEVSLEDSRVAAYAPMIVLRGRGREGKTIVIEGSGNPDPSTIAKIEAFRGKYGQEFYVIFVAPEEVLDDISLLAYDESCTTTDLHTLVSRLAE